MNTFKNKYKKMNQINPIRRKKTMNNKKHRYLLTLLLGTAILMVFNINLLSYISLNGSGSGYESGTPNGGKSIGVNEIEGYVIDGAGYYLEAKSSIEAILNRVEYMNVKGIDYAELSLLVDNALVKIQAAGAAYEQLIVIAEKTPYNQAVIDQLKSFDYDQFMELNNLNPVIFKEAARYLSRGDITGIYKHTYQAVKAIEAILLDVKESVSLRTIPGIPVFRQLNEQCCRTSLFGSYCARIFHQVLATE
jgi:hypothetical protein